MFGQKTKFKQAPDKLHVRTGDNVEVISGKDKGKRGEVLEVSLKEGKVIVNGINVATKHLKHRGPTNPGGIIKVEAPIYSSKVMLVCPRCKSKTRLARKFTGDGEKERLCKKCGDTY